MLLLWYVADIVAEPILSNVRAMYREWLRTGLAKPGKSGKGLARHLGVSEPVVSRMLSGKRKIKADELPAIAAYLEEAPPRIPSGEVGIVAEYGQRNDNQPTLNNHSRVTRLLEGRGVIAPGHWREGGVEVPVQKIPIPAHPDPRLANFDQYYCQILIDNNKFPICVPFDEIRSAPLHGDLVHVVRQRGDMFEESLRRVHIHNGTVELRLEDGKPSAVVLYPSADPAETVTIKGLVVAYHISLFS